MCSMVYLSPNWCYSEKILRGKGREERVFQLLSLLLAALVGYGAARFASRLAGGLAFAAAAGFGALGQAGLLDRLNMLHFNSPLALVSYQFSISFAM